jgi:spermidine synthase
MFNFKKKIHKSVTDASIVEVSEQGGVRSLHLGSITVQSSMRVKDPNYLELAYTRGMMGFLLFCEQPKKAVTIGLGGGSIAKYIHSFCPQIAQTVLDINQQVINIAHSHFAVPFDDSSLQILCEDGVAYLQNHPNFCDVLLIDAFDSEGVPDDCCSQDFFDACFVTLQKHGVFAMNLWGSNKHFDVYLQRIEQAFDDHVLILPTGKPGNIVVFGLKGLAYNGKLLQKRADALESTHRIEYKDFATKIIELNRERLSDFARDFNH